MNASHSKASVQAAPAYQRQLDLAFFLGVPLILSLTMTLVGRQIEILGMTGGSLYVAALSFVPWWMAGLATQIAVVALRTFVLPPWIIAALGVLLSLPFVTIYVQELNSWFQTRWPGGHALPLLSWPDSLDRLRGIALSAGRAIVLWTAFVLVFIYTLGWSRYTVHSRTNEGRADNRGPQRTRLLNNGQEWSREDEEKLAALVKAGIPLKSIAIEMRRTSSAIKTRMKKLGLPHPSK